MQWNTSWNRNVNPMLRLLRWVFDVPCCGYSMLPLFITKTNCDFKDFIWCLIFDIRFYKIVFYVLEFFHFACTSEDINNLAHALALKEAFNTVIFPVMIELLIAICKLVKENAHISMLSRTHGQVFSVLDERQLLL